MNKYKVYVLEHNIYEIHVEADCLEQAIVKTYQNYCEGEVVDTKMEVLSASQEGDVACTIIQ